MLVLSRLIGQSIIINDDIEVRILGITGRQVRIGVDAPKHVPVHRKEIYDRILQEKEVEQSVSPTTLSSKA